MARYIKSGTVNTVQEINSELEKIATAQEDFLSRSGETPNEMLGTFDANGKRFINLPAPIFPSDPVRLSDINLTEEFTLNSGGGALLVADFAELSSLSAIAGTQIICTGRDNAFYLVESPAVSFEQGDAYTSEGNLIKLQKKGVLNTTWFGDNITDIKSAYTAFPDRTFGLYKDITTAEEIDISNINLEGISSAFVADTGFTGAVLSSTNNSNTQSNDSRIRVKGNATTSTSVDGTCTGVLLDNDRSPMSTYDVRVSGCEIGLNVNGDTEKKVLQLHAAYCKKAYVETTVGGSPDSINVTISGTRCEKWYETGGEVSSHVTFNVESNTTPPDPDHYVITNQGGKAITMAGIVRGTTGNCIKLTRVDGTGVTTWQDLTHFDDLKVIQVDDGIALYTERALRLSGNVVLYDCQNNSGPTLFIGDTKDCSTFRPAIKKCFSLYGAQIGDSVTYPAGLDMVLSISMGDIYSTSPSDLNALYLSNAQECNLFLEICEGNILLDGAVECTLSISSDFIKKGYTMTGGDQSTKVSVRGSLDVSDLDNISWKDNVASITLENVSTYNVPISYEGGKWSSGIPFVSEEIDFDSRNSDINTLFKKVGTASFSTTASQSYLSTGTAPVSTWVRYDATVAKTPALLPETTTLIARLPNAITTAEENLYDRFLYDLKRAGILSKMKILYLGLTATKANAEQNIIANNYHLTDVGGSVIHTPYEGLVGGGGIYSDTGYDITALTPTSFSAGVMSLVTTSDSEQDMESSGFGGIRVRTRRDSGSYVRLMSGDNDQLEMTSIEPSDLPRLVTGTRLGATQTIYADGNVSGSNTVTEDVTEGILHINRSNRPMGMAFLADYLTKSEVKALSSAASTYLASATKLIVT